MLTPKSAINVTRATSFQCVIDDEELFNGSVWTAESALKLGLIDGIDQAETFIHRNYGDEVKVNRLKGKYEDLLDMFGSRNLLPQHSISEMMESDSKRIKI